MVICFACRNFRLTDINLSGQECVNAIKKTIHFPVGVYRKGHRIYAYLMIFAIVVINKKRRKLINTLKSKPCGNIMMYC